MLFDLPDHATLYRALQGRDSAYDGQAYVCVVSTGIFCRLTCPARKPKPENCTFYATVGECITAGYRPCKRCKPLAPMAASDPAIATLLGALEERPEHRWSEEDVARMGFDPSTVRRGFKRQFGMTFLEMARQRRLRDGFETIRGGGKVIEAQLDARFDSASAFRAAFARLLGRAPGSFDQGALLLADWVTTPLGDMISICSRSLCRIPHTAGLFRVALRAGRLGGTAADSARCHPQLFRYRRAYRAANGHARRRARQWCQPDRTCRALPPRHRGRRFLDGLRGRVVAQAEAA